MTITALIVLIAAAALIIAIQKKKAAQNQGTQPSSATTRQGNTPEDEFKDIMDSLVKLNLLIRKDQDFSTEMTQEIEAVIDDLKVVIPAMMDRYPGETLTYEIKKIGKEHLYKTVKEFLDLSVQSRENQLDIFKKTIDSLHDISKRSRDIVENNETAEFKTMANFLAGKFS